MLPRFSSGNFTEADIGTPILEILLKAGDMLYFPRGFIHQGTAQEHTHSLHITLSVYQKNSWADLFETVNYLFSTQFVGANYYTHTKTVNKIIKIEYFLVETYTNIEDYFFLFLENIIRFVKLNNVKSEFTE